MKLLLPKLMGLLTTEEISKGDSLVCGPKKDTILSSFFICLLKMVIEFSANNRHWDKTKNGTHTDRDYEKGREC